MTSETATETDLAAELVFREGRGFNNKRDDYILPGDAQEHLRLDIQHTALKLLVGSLYPAEETVKKLLAGGQVRRPKVLDIGTGSGVWAMEMAMEFPQADVSGMDLVPPAVVSSNKQSIPPNCRFEVGDANTYLEPFKEEYDVIQVRSLQHGIADFYKFLYDVAAALRPGGLLILCAGSPQLYHSDGTPFPVADEGEPNFTWLQLTFNATYESAMNRGHYSIQAPLLWHGWLDNNPNFSDAITTEHLGLLGPPKPDDTAEHVYAGSLFRQSVKDAVYAFKARLLLDYPRDVVEEWVEKSAAEMQNCQVPDCYLKWTYTTALRKEQPFVDCTTPAPPVDHTTLRLVVPRQTAPPS